MYLEFTYQMQMVRLSLFSCSIFVLCRMNTICTFSDSLGAFALLASQKIILDRVERRALQSSTKSQAMRPFCT